MDVRIIFDGHVDSLRRGQACARESRTIRGITELDATFAASPVDPDICGVCGLDSKSQRLGDRVYVHVQKRFVASKVAGNVC